MFCQYITHLNLFSTSLDMQKADVSRSLYSIRIGGQVMEKTLGDYVQAVRDLELYNLPEIKQQVQYSSRAEHASAVKNDCNRMVASAKVQLEAQLKQEEASKHAALLVDATALYEDVLALEEIGCSFNDAWETGESILIEDCHCSEESAVSIMKEVAIRHASEGMFQPYRREDSPGKYTLVSHVNSYKSCTIDS